MISPIVVPSMGATGEDVILTEWLVKEGDSIKAGQPIFAVETDKATTEVEAFRGGYLRKIVVPAGGTAAIGDTLGIIADSMQEPLEDAGDCGPQKSVAQPRVEVAGNKEIGAAVPHSDAPSSSGRVRASPMARRLARERGIDLASLRTDGPIHQADVLKAAASNPPAAAQEAVLSPMRRAIAVRTLQSKTQIPHFYVTARIDMTETQALQRRIASASERRDRPTVTDLVIRATAMALRETPELNASFKDNRIVRHDNINIGIVVGLPEGMIVPVIRRADAQDLRQLAATTKRLRDQALAGRLATEDLAGGTFTISNLGMFGIESFIAVINPPEAAILALGAIQSQPAVVEGRIVPRAIMTATLSVDHRVADGVTAARFLGQLRQTLENPALLLKEMDS